MGDPELSMTPRKYDVTIEYCVPCDYSEAALRATRELAREYQHVLDQLSLRMGSGGAFEVEVDGELIFSKLELGRKPEPDEIRRRFEEFVGEPLPSYQRG